MIKSTIDKNQTGIASEYYVVAELFRLGYDVTITSGKTKTVDILAIKDDKPIAIQVKGMRSPKISVNWNIDKNKIKDSVIYVLVNLNANDLNLRPEFFILTSKEAKQLFIDTTKSGNQLKRAYLSYNKIKGDKLYENNWSKLETNFLLK